MKSFLLTILSLVFATMTIFAQSSSVAETKLKTMEMVLKLTDAQRPQILEIYKVQVAQIAAVKKIDRETERGKAAIKEANTTSMKSIKGVLTKEQFSDWCAYLRDK